MIDASFILDAIQRKYSSAAIVPELTINDPYWHDWSDIDQRGERSDEGVKPARRIDALMMQTFERTAIEIKISKQDYFLDTELKRRPWERVCHRFIYAVPDYLDVMAPHGCGLWKVDAWGHITVAKRSIINRHPEQLPQDVIQRLMYRAAKQPQLDPPVAHYETPALEVPP